MSTFFKLNKGKSAQLIMPVDQADRLRRTCFRGTRCRKAGNFSAWSNFAQFLKDEEARILLSEAFERLIAEAQVNSRHRVELEFNRNVGWDSVLGTDELTDEDLAACTLRRINNRCEALFLPDDHILAPTSSVVTMVLKMLHDDSWKFIVGTMYPGPDCGRLSGGNLTEQRGLVFLPWSTPGE